MALNGTELLVISHLLGKRGRARPRVLSLGYPDLLIRPSFVEECVPTIDMRKIKLRPDSGAVGRGHNFPNEGIFDAHDFFAELDAVLEVVDFADLGHGERVLNLNNPVGWRWRRRYDLIIDPGTIEHCFNVATAMKNVAQMLTTGGFVYHQAAIVFCNHGFYSLSPTFFVDFYASNGFEIGQPFRWGEGASMDPRGMVGPLSPIDHQREYPELGGMTIGCYAARKRSRRPIIWPIQYKYGNRASRSLAFCSFIEDALVGRGVLSSETPFPRG
jgi:hypothetical protein